VTEPRCQNCGEPAALPYDGWVLCKRCADRFVESDRRWAEYQAGLITWNTSLHDPFWRGWLRSRELFDALHSTAPRVGERIHSVLGGNVFECGRGSACWVQVWVAPGEVLVAYPSVSERYNYAEAGDGPQEFERWVWNLRHSPRLELGLVLGRCSYGATLIDSQPLPVVKWAQAGDWAALARGWFVGVGRVLAPWP
jgi:hypothetical protein